MGDNVNVQNTQSMRVKVCVCLMLLVAIAWIFTIGRQILHSVRIWEYYVDIGVCKLVYVLISTTVLLKHWPSIDVCNTTIQYNIQVPKQALCNM